MRTGDPSSLRCRVTGIDLHVSHGTPGALGDPTHLLRVAGVGVDVYVEYREALHEGLVVARLNVEFGLDVAFNIFTVVNALFTAGVISFLFLVKLRAASIATSGAPPAATPSFSFSAILLIAS